jgi:hypothetical protein
VRQLVHDDVPQVLVRAGERQHDAVLEQLGEAARGAVEHLGGDVGLREVVVQVRMMGTLFDRT